MTDIVDVDEFARIFQVTKKTVFAWIKSGMPVENHGTQGGGEERNITTIDLREAVEWYFHENFERLELDRERTKLASEQAQRFALENAVRIGELGELKIWREELGRFLVEIRSALLSWPTKIAPLLDGDVNQRKDRLEQAVHEVLRKLASYRPTEDTKAVSTSDSGTAEDFESAAALDGEPVGGHVSATLKGKQRRARRMAN